MGELCMIVKQAVGKERCRDNYNGTGEFSRRPHPSTVRLTQSYRRDVERSRNTSFNDVL
jgi:hypothetical protein